MFKMMVFLKKRAGMSKTAFREYYESCHALLVRRTAPKMRRYVRNYLTPLGNEVYAAQENGEVDCITEAWFETDEDFEATMADILATDLAKALVEDEERLFDRPFIRWFRADEIESDLKSAIP